MWVALLLALAPAQESATIRVKFVDGGAPLAGVELRTRAPDSPVTRGSAFSKLNGEVLWVEPLSTGERMSLVLEAHYPGRPVAYWKVELAQGKALDLGTIELRTGTVSGRILARDGETCVRGWSVSGHVSFSSPSRTAHDLAASIDPATGEFQFVDVPVGKFLLFANYPPLQLVSTAGVGQVEPGRETYLTLKFDGPDPRNSLSIELRCAGAPKDLSTVLVRVTNAAGEVREASPRVRSGGGKCTLHGLGAGSYRLELSEPRIAPVSREIPGGGCQVSVKLIGAASLSLTLRAAEDGARFRAFRVRRMVNGKVTLLPFGSQKRAGVYHVIGLFPGRHTLQVKVPLRGTYTFETPELLAGEPVEFTFEVPGRDD